MCCVWQKGPSPFEAQVIFLIRFPTTDFFFHKYEKYTTPNNICSHLFIMQAIVLKFGDISYNIILHKTYYFLGGVARYT